MLLRSVSVLAPLTLLCCCSQVVSPALWFVTVASPAPSPALPPPRGFGWADFAVRLCLNAAASALGVPGVGAGKDRAVP